MGAHGPEVTAVGQPAVECPGYDLVLHGGTQNLKGVAVEANY